jgi:hypothetical protein
MRLTESTEKSDHQHNTALFVGCGQSPHPTYTAHLLELGLFSVQSLTSNRLKAHSNLSSPCG